MLTQEVEVGAENLGIGIVTQARFVRETLAMLDAPVHASEFATAGLSGTPAAAVSPEHKTAAEAVTAESGGVAR